MIRLYVEPVDLASGYFRRFLAYAFSYKTLMLLAIGAGIAKFSLNYTFPWLIGSAIDEVIRPTEGTPAFSRTIEQRYDYLRTLIWIGVVLSILHGLSTFARGWYTAKLGSRIIADLRQDLFDHLHRLSLHFYSKERTGSIISRLITDIQTASQIINGGVITVVMDIFSITIGLVLLTTISWKLTLACMVIMPLYAITFRYLNPRVKRASARVQSQLSKISGNVQERLAGIALVKTYAAEGRERQRFVEDTEEHYDRTIQQSALAQTVSAISETLIHFGQLIVIGLGGYYALHGALKPGEVVKFIGWLAVMYLPVRRFAELTILYQTSLAAIERVFQVFDVTPTIRNKPEGVKHPPESGRVEFDQVTFAYNIGGESPLPDIEKEIRVAPLERVEPPAGANGQPAADARLVLNGISFVAEPGQKIAFVGPSGSGKTTLVSLLPRLYDVTGGRILIDGVDVRDYKQRALRRGIGIVQQDSFLFSGTIRENIAYGRPDATDEQVIEAARAANAHDFIHALPEDYQARLGERGVNLSGGQRQRISIARAILKDPRILILDEATSALDSESESLVQEALVRLMEGRTCFIIAHRLSTVRHADRILVLQQGRIVETGRHDELLDQGGLYAKLVKQQFGIEPFARSA